MPEVVLVPGKNILTEAGGHATYSRAMALAARRAGFTPHLFCLGPREEVIETELGTIHHVPSPLRWILRHGPGEGLRSRFLPFHQGPIRRRLDEFLATRTGPLIVHGVGPFGVITLDAVERVRRSDLVVIPIVTVFSSMEDEHSAKRRGVSGAHGYAARFRAEVEYQWTKRTLIPRDVRAITESARVLVNYQSVADQVRAIPGHAPIEIVPYATEAAFEEPLRPRPRPKALAGLGPAAAPLLVCVSRHDSRKGLDVLIEALGILRRSDIPFRACLVGPGPLLETHRRLARAHGIGDSVELVGYAPDPVAYLQHADVFCLPSLQEGSGSLSLLEAMQTGATIVASDVDGIPEDVTDGESAVLVPPGDAGALADGLARVLGDTQLRNRLAGRARVVFEERFSADVFSRSVRDLYHELLREASAGG